MQSFTSPHNTASSTPTRTQNARGVSRVTRDTDVAFSGPEVTVRGQRGSDVSLAWLPLEMETGCNLELRTGPKHVMSKPDTAASLLQRCSCCAASAFRGNSQYRHRSIDTRTTSMLHDSSAAGRITASRRRRPPKTLDESSEPPMSGANFRGRVGDNMIEELEKALTFAFPPVMIDRAMIDEPTAIWDVYEDYADLAAFESKTWRELAPELLYKHSALLLWAGDAFWRATLPGYLWYLLHERTLFNDLPWQLAGELTRSDDPAARLKFDRRIAALSAEQRAVIRDVVALLATMRPMEQPMSRA